MTFEEFFAKKKIDLTALQKADNSLYEEFKKHYMAMGSKSFDHTKKFWFNKLRKSYHLAETPIDKKEVQQAIVKEQQSVKAEATTTATGFKPRFKAPAPKKDVLSQESETPINRVEKISESAPDNDGPAKPTGFKPRFKAPTVTQDIVPQETETSNNRVDKTSDSASDNDVIVKPTGFKPRFKAGVTKPAAEQNTIPTDQQAEGQADHLGASHPATEATSADLPTEASSKPAGFKPRFKAGITKQATAAQHNIPTEQQAQELTDHLGASDPATETISTDLQTEASSKPAGFKPRFKAGITKQATAVQDNIPTEKQEQTDKTVASNLATETTPVDLPTETSSKPAGFKPRFKAGITKQATAAQDNIPTEQQVEGQTDKTVASIPTTETAPVDLPTQESSKPAGFKPRFKAGVTKLKNKDTD
ncbi:hypothetical protein SF1_00870 [Sphingobacterium faecium NBRC 15299]|uniref:hypothetical protein n=1 Tax=Sphingobacterium faecium TaxID=34087 RepID=UPI000D3D7EEA|nr:hypothetical protein [Sphingobacterium faecium]PTX12397.1 hypothetical protein C8N37_10291 [Sphingobacterium faecium]GEM62105.1 hypothetical protein SF1_00870 [Sphingobacterium faecium NBRC 15299]